MRSPRSDWVSRPNCSRVIQDREFSRLGGKKDIRVNVRVLAATNKDLEKAAIKVESEVIAKALEISRWNRRKTAEMLQISYKALLYKMKGGGIQKQQHFGY